MYGNFCKALAAKGFVVVNSTYRLSPHVRHPEHVRDTAKALKWIYTEIHRFGGDRNKIFVSGHSAGGFITASLSLNPSYLNELGLSTKIIKGCVGISGVYDVSRIANWKSPVTLFNKFVLFSIPICTFGKNDPKLFFRESPVNLLTGEVSPCPFLLFSAKRDFQLEKDAQKLDQVLRSRDIKVKYVHYNDGDHVSIVGLFSPNLKVVDEISRWIVERCDSLNE